MIKKKIIDMPYYKKVSGPGPNEVSFFGAFPGDNYQVKYRPALELNDNGRITIHNMEKMDYPTFKKEFLELFREYMVNKTGGVAKTGDVNSFFKPYNDSKGALEKMDEYQVKYPEYYARFSEEDWDL